MAKPLGIGLVGGGMVGQLAHLANFVQNPDCRVVALAELRPDLGRRVAAKFGIERVYPSHAALLEDPAVEAVVVVTRRPALGPVVMDVLSAGRHVLSEKPMAHTVAQAERLVAAAQRADRHYGVGYMKRHDAGAQRAKGLLDRFRASGELGAIQLVRCYCHAGDFACNADGFVMTDEERPEGLELWPIAPEDLSPALHQDYAWFLNVYSHDLNILRYLFGATPTVVGVDFLRPRGKSALLAFDDVTAILECAESSGTRWSEGVDVIFERGRLSLAFPPPLLRNVSAAVSVHRAGADGPVSQVEQEWSWAFQRQAAAFVADIRAGRQPLASGADAVEDLRLAEALWRRHDAAMRSRQS